jgi:hypothetical protein
MQLHCQAVLIAASATLHHAHNQQRRALRYSVLRKKPGSPPGTRDTVVPAIG